MGLQIDAVIASSLERFVSALGEPPPVEAKNIVVVERSGLWACAGRQIGARFALVRLQPS